LNDGFKTIDSTQPWTRTALGEKSIGTFGYQVSNNNRLRGRSEKLVNWMRKPIVLDTDLSMSVDNESLNQRKRPSRVGMPTIKHVL